MRAILAALAALMMLAPAPARAQEHRHPPQDLAIHEQFYSTWFMPDQPTRSCCNKQDCYPTEAKFEGGRWYAQRREDLKWMLVPPEKMERNRDNPDGRSHVCMARPEVGEFLFCFTLGWGS